MKKIQISRQLTETKKHSASKISMHFEMSHILPTFGDYDESESSEYQALITPPEEKPSITSSIQFVWKGSERSKDRYAPIANSLDEEETKEAKSWWGWGYW